MAFFENFGDLFRGLLGRGDSTILRGFFFDDEVSGTDAAEVIVAGFGNDTVRAGGGNDEIEGGIGNDIVLGESGDDIIFGDFGDDVLIAGPGIDSVRGGAGNDVLHGDSGPTTPRGELDADSLDGGSGNDTLHQSEGNDSMTGGPGQDVFQFKFRDPQTALAAGTGPAFTRINDFVSADDTIAFDLPGFGTDALGANFAATPKPAGGPDSPVDSFFSGAAAGAGGQTVVVVTDQAFATGAAAAAAVPNEDAGDFIVYFNTTVNTGSLLVVNAPNTVTSIARFTNVGSAADLASLTQSDFIAV